MFTHLKLARRQGQNTRSKFLYKDFVGRPVFGKEKDSQIMILLRVGFDNFLVFSVEPILIKFCH